MAQRSAMIALTDMVEAIERVCALMEGVSLEAFAQDWQRQWLVENYLRGKPASAQCVEGRVPCLAVEEDRRDRECFAA